MSDDHILRFLTLLAILLFVSAGILPRTRGREPWMVWLRRGTVAVFALAMLYALALVAMWIVQRPR